MPAKTASKPKSKTKEQPVSTELVPYSLADIQAITTTLNEAQKMFCWYFVFNDELRNNATRAYAFAYGYDLDDETKYPKDDAVWDFDDEGKPTKVIRDSSYERASSVCSSNAHRLLTNAEVQSYIVKLRNTLLSDEIVDAELAKVIVQDHDLAPKVKAIQVYNELRKRTGDDKGPPGTLVQNFTQINIHPSQQA